MNKTIVRIYPSKKLDFICLSVIRVGKVRKIGDKVILIDQKYLNQNKTISINRLLIGQNFEIHH
jgi:hypothetical protein